MLQDFKDKLPQIHILCNQHHVANLSVFGSAIDDRFDPESSDIDFLVEFSNGLTAPQYADAFFTLKTDLEALFGRRVDLITRRSLTNPYLKASVLAEERALYAA